MRKKQNFAILVLTIFSFIILLASIYFIILKKAKLNTISFIFLAGIALISVFILISIASDTIRKRKRKSIKKPDSSALDLLSPSTVSESVPRQNKTESQPKKRTKAKPIDLNIRHYDDTKFAISRNALQTAGNMIMGTRHEQQDSMFVSDTTYFFDDEEALILGVVCDGMGGMSNGAEASKIATHTLSTMFMSAPSIPDIALFFRNAIYKANESIQKLSLQNGELKRAGTTLVSVIIRNNMLYRAAVGDSRIYLVRDGQLVLLTRDHNYYLLLQQRLKNGEISTQQFERDPQKEALISYLGMQELKLMDISEEPLPLLDGDVILLCSDGLTKSLSKDEIYSIITNNAGNLPQCASMLTSAAQRKSPRGLDNTSVILIKYN